MRLRDLVCRVQRLSEKRPAATERPLTTEEARRELIRMTADIVGKDPATLSDEDENELLRLSVEIGDEIERRCSPDGEWLPGCEPGAAESGEPA